jgi:hypothetical protein
MQQRRGDGDAVKLEVGADAGGTQRVVDEILTALAKAALVLRF